MYLNDRQGRIMKMDIKKKNILTACVLMVIALCIYVFAVMRAMSQ